MRIAVILGLIIGSCSSEKKDPGFTSVEGTWKYTTTDGKVGVTFELDGTSSANLALVHQTMTLDGAAVESAAQMTGVALPVIAKIRINANDASVVFPFNIEFDSCYVSADYKIINVPHGSYTWPWGTVNTLTDIDIVRQ